MKVIAPRSLDELMREIQGNHESHEELEKLRSQLLNRPEWRSRDRTEIDRLRSDLRKFNERVIESQRRLVFGAWAMHQLSDKQMSRNVT